MLRVQRMYENAKTSITDLLLHLLVLMNEIYSQSAPIFQISAKSNNQRLSYSWLKKSL